MAVHMSTTFGIIGAAETPGAVYSERFLTDTPGISRSAALVKHTAPLSTCQYCQVQPDGNPSGRFVMPVSNCAVGQHRHAWRSA